MTMGEEDDAERSFHGALEEGEKGRERGRGERGGGRGEETKEEEEGGGAGRGPKHLEEGEEGSQSRWCTCAAPAATTADGRRTRKGLRIAGCVVVVLSLLFLAVLSAYLGLVATIEREFCLLGEMGGMGGCDGFRMSLFPCFLLLYLSPLLPSLLPFLLSLLPTQHRSSPCSRARCRTCLLTVPLSMQSSLLEARSRTRARSRC